MTYIKLEDVQEIIDWFWDDEVKMIMVKNLTSINPEEIITTEIEKYKWNNWNWNADFVLEELLKKFNS